MIGTRKVSLEDGTRIEHRNTGSEIAPDPVDMSGLLDDGSFGIEIIGIVTPVFDARIPEVRTSTNQDLDTPSMEGRTVVLGRTASLDVVCICSIFDDDDRMFELSSIPHIHAEIRLKRF